MNILLNGEQTTIEDGLTLALLIEGMELQGARYAVEVNEELIPRSEHGDHALEDGDAVEIVQAIGGG